MLDISDHKVWEATKLLYNAFRYDDQLQRLDPDNLKEFKHENIKPLYPHKIGQEGAIEKYTCGEACCVVQPGSFYCCKTTTPDSSFKKLGLGLCLYFKFMKHSSVVFMAIAVLTIFSCMICLLVSAQNGFALTADYQTFLFSTTLGAFSAERIKCQYQKLPTTASALDFTINCPYGKVSLIGPVYSTQSLSTLYNCKNQIKRYQSGDATYIPNGQTVSCNQAISSCSVQFASVSSSNNFTTIAFSYQCLNQAYSLGLYEVKSQYLLYTVVGIDLLCCIILAIFYYSEGKAEQLEIQFFKQSQLSLNDFSLKITGLNITTFNEQFDVIVKSLTKLMGDQLPSEIVQVKTPERIDFVEYQNKKNEAYENLYKFIVQQFFDHEVNPAIFKDAEDFIDRNFQAGKYEKYRDYLIKYIEEFYFLEYDANEKRASKTCSIFIVLNTIGMKKRIYDAQKDGCFKKYFAFGDKEYVLSQPPSPDLIIWKNKGKLTFFRVILSWLITLSICMSSYMLFGYIQYQQNRYLSTYNFNINCNVLYTSGQLDVYTPNDSDSNYLTCFCLNHLFQLGNNPQCSELQKSYFTYLAIPVIISLFLVFYNVAVSTFFKKLTKFQCHRMITAELFSYTIKRAFLLIMNMALIMIILNIQYNTSYIGAEQFSFLLQGKYSDITPDWYMNIGTIIVLTMIFNITFPIIELLLANFLKCIKKCWDKKLCCVKTSCKTKNQYIQLYVDDVYPIEERYAFVISVLMITLAFGSVIPILNFICAVSLMLLYFADRVLVFKVYQTPVNYGPQLHKLINKTIYIGLIAHFALSAYFFSQTNLIANSSTIPSENQLNSRNARINAMISTYYIIPYVVLFAFFAGWSFFNNTLVACCDKCLQICKKNLSHITQYKLERTFYDTLSSYQIQKLKLMIQGELSKLTTKQNAYKSIRKNKDVLNQTIKGLSLNLITNDMPKAPLSEHQSLLRRTLMRLKAEESLRRQERMQQNAYLIGHPSFEVMVNDDAFEQHKKNNLLSSSLGQLLKDVLQGMNQ